MRLQSGTRSFLIFLVFLLWLAAAGAGAWSMARYASEPGRQSSAPPDFPAAEFSFDRTRPTLVMLAHPRCPCTRASLAELAELIERNPQGLRAHVLFYQPSRASADWSRTDIWETAEAIPGVTVYADRDAAGTRLFGAYTSGQTLLYDTDGRLVFKGGLTAGRGHRGGNSGRDAVEEYLRRGATEIAASSVFGCAISGDDDEIPTDRNQ